MIKEGASCCCGRLIRNRNGMKKIGVRAHSSHNPFLSVWTFWKLPNKIDTQCMKWSFVEANLYWPVGLRNTFKSKTCRASAYPVTNMFSHLTPIKILGKGFISGMHDACLSVNRGRCEVNGVRGKYHWEQHIRNVWGRTCTHLCRPRHHPLIYRTLQNMLQARVYSWLSKCTTKDLSSLLTKLLSTIKDGLVRYCNTKTSRNGVNDMWILKNSTSLLSSLDQLDIRTATSVQTIEI